MPRKTAALSKGEMVVASALWRLKSASLGELHEEVAKSDSMEYATVQSYIRRLETKGYVKAKRVGRNNIYSPKIKPEKVIGQTLDQMMKQLFDGKAIPLFRHLISERGISESELAELREIVDSAEGKPESDDGGEE
jgi:predicted transcriptional regulator